MPRLKLPAYGKRLLEERRAGRHPLEVNLCYGDRWREIAAPLIAIDPKDYAPGKYDFHMLAGLRVTIHDQLAGGWELAAAAQPTTYGKFYDLVREAAAADAWVLIRWPAGTEPRESSAQMMAFNCRWWCTERRAWQWPRWWSAELDAQQSARCATWCLDVYRDSERGRAAA